MFWVVLLVVAAWFAYKIAFGFLQEKQRQDNQLHERAAMQRIEEKKERVARDRRLEAAKLFQEIKDKDVAFWMRGEKEEAWADALREKVAPHVEAKEYDDVDRLHGAAREEAYAWFLRQSEQEREALRAEYRAAMRARATPPEFPVEDWKEKYPDLDADAVARHLREIYNELLYWELREHCSYFTTHDVFWEFLDALRYDVKWHALREKPAEALKREINASAYTEPVDDVLRAMRKRQKELYKQRLDALAESL